VTRILRSRLRLAAPVILLGLAVPVVAQAVSQGAAASARAASTVQPGAEGQLLSLTNSARAGAGLSPLVSSPTLVALARGWSAQMAAAHALSHNPNLAGSVSGWYMIGENVAQAGSASQAQSLFMASSEHRANILEPVYNRVGIGVVVASDGSVWFTVDFEQTAGYSPAAHQGAVHHWAPPAGRSVSSSAAALTAARLAALARTTRSLARRAVPPASTASAPATVSGGKVALLTAQDDGATAVLAGSAALAFGPTRAGASGSPGALVAFGAATVLLVLFNTAWQLHAQRRPTDRA